MKRFLSNYKNFVKTGKNNIFRVDFHILGGCNFRCIMCDNWKNEYEVNFTKAEFKKVILVLKLKFHCDYIRFHGQEATLYKDINDLVVFSKKLKMKVGIKTNGWLLTDKRLYNMIDSGLDELYLSVDGSLEEVHDSIRGIKGSFRKNFDLVKKTKKYAPKVKIYINSVVMSQNFETLPGMVDLCHSHGVDRQSYVFLNDKNRKDIGHVNLSKKEFLTFFREMIPSIFQKSVDYKIPVDFSPFVSEFVGAGPQTILDKLSSDNPKYSYQIENFYEGLYGKDFYDRYGCHGPIDHASINYNGDMFGCCVVERDRGNKVGNIIEDDLKGLWDDSRYKLYRQRSNFGCSYGHKCASNFYTRKHLFKNIYLDSSLYDMTHPYNYYRYIKEINNEPLSVLQDRSNQKLSHLFENNIFVEKWYRPLCNENSINLDQISMENFGNLPVIRKNDVSELYDYIDEEIFRSDATSTGHTSGSSGFRLDFATPLNFRRHVKQVAMFSEISNFTFYDGYFSVTPYNCSQGTQDSAKLPTYVKKEYVNITEFGFSKTQLESIQASFASQDYKYLYGDSKYLLYIILLYQKYSCTLPQFEHIFLAYSYTNTGLKNYINKSFGADVTEIYGCSEVGPIAYSSGEGYTIFGDNLVVEEVDGEIVLTDLENPFFPFIRYKNGDLGKVQGSTLQFQGKKGQQIGDKSLTEIDEGVYTEFPEIVYYQFVGNKLLYYSNASYNTKDIEEFLLRSFGSSYTVEERGEESFFQVSQECGKYKVIN